MGKCIQVTRHSNENDTAHHSDMPAQRKLWNTTSVEKVVFGSIYVEPVDIDDPCEQVLNFAIGILANQR